MNSIPTFSITASAFTSVRRATTTSTVPATTSSRVVSTASSSAVSKTSSYTVTATVTPTITPKMVPAMVPNVTIPDNTFNINGNNVTLTLSWGEPFNNLNPIVNYTVSCSGNDRCPPNFTTTDNTTRNYTITNLTTMITYTFSVVATNSIGSGKAGVVQVTTPAGESIILLTVINMKGFYTYYRLYMHT